MTTSEHERRSPVELVHDGVGEFWNSIRTVYWANSPGWRLLKAGALLFMGFFLWTGSNVVMSYKPGWTPLQYTMAYGFVVIAYGPFHHLVVIPLAMRWRRSSGLRQRVARRLPNAGLAAFLIVAVVLGTFPPAVMAVDFQSNFGADSTPDINPALDCVRTTQDGEAVVECRLSESEGIDHVEVRSGGEVIVTERDSPAEFVVPESKIREQRGEKQFVVVLLDEDDRTIRRYSRMLSTIDSDR